MAPILTVTVQQPTAESFRHADAAALEGLMATLRGELARVWQAWRRALAPDMGVSYAGELNPPRWELGHIGWYEDYWIGRNPQRLRGCLADPAAPRAAPAVWRADALYDSSKVPHTRRWHLDLPGADATWRDVQAVRERTLVLLRQCADDDDTLYFYRLAFAHEAMHLEAWLVMSQSLAIDLHDCSLPLQPARCDAGDEELAVGGGRFTMGAADTGFAFDNELGAHEVELRDFRIDAHPVSWQRFLPFVEAGGYDEARWWSPQGWQWRQRESTGKPRHLNRDGPAWLRALFGQWVPLDPAQPAVHLSAHEAEAWCRWAGRRLPTEAEWERAASACGDTFAWGDVWEWTASAFAPYPGFAPHPYRDYSLPWFDGRPVLRGASFATQATLRDPRYRNFYAAGRNDIFAGFRSCPA